jgi:hypothetical protein
MAKIQTYEKVRKALYDYKLITYDKNIVWAERAFMANSVAQWCIRKISNKEFSQKQIDSFGKILFLYLRNKIDLEWKDDMISVRIKQKKNLLENGTKKAN